MTTPIVVIDALYCSIALPVLYHQEFIFHMIATSLFAVFLSMLANLMHTDSGHALPGAVVHTNSGHALPGVITTQSGHALPGAVERRPQSGHALPG